MLQPCQVSHQAAHSPCLCGKKKNCETFLIQSVWLHSGPASPCDLLLLPRCSDPEHRVFSPAAAWRGRRRRRGEGVGREGGGLRRGHHLRSGLDPGAGRWRVGPWDQCEGCAGASGKTLKHKNTDCQDGGTQPIGGQNLRRGALGWAGQIESWVILLFFFSVLLFLFLLLLCLFRRRRAREALVNAWQIIFLRVSGERGGR